MKKLAILLLLILLLTSCRSDNGASKPLPSDLSSSTNEETIFIQPEELTLSVGETASLVCKTASEQIVADNLPKKLIAIAIDFFIFMIKFTKIKLKYFIFI